MKSLSLCAVLLSLTVVAAQEAPGVLPDAYRVQFENAWVRVTSVRYGPLEKVPAHSHTPYPTVVPAPVHATARAAERFFERRTRVSTRTCGLSNTSRTVV